MTAYRRGTYLELRVAKQMVEDGYFVVSAKGSKGPADLVALKPGQVLLMQVKSADELWPAEWNRLVDLANGLGALPILVYREKGKLVFWRLTGHKVPYGAAPREPWTADEVAA